MPVRPRRGRRHGTVLTPKRYMDLVLGPDRLSEPLDMLSGVFLDHRRRFVATDWAVDYFEHGLDTRESEATGTDCPGLPMP